MLEYEGRLVFRPGGEIIFQAYCPIRGRDCHVWDTGFTANYGPYLVWNIPQLVRAHLREQHADVLTEVS